MLFYTNIEGSAHGTSSAIGSPKTNTGQRDGAFIRFMCDEGLIAKAFHASFNTMSSL